MVEIVRFRGRLGRDADRMKRAHDLVADVETSLRRPGEAWSGLWLLVRTAVVRLAHHLGAEQVARRLEAYAAELRGAEIRGASNDEVGHDR